MAVVIVGFAVSMGGCTANRPSSQSPRYLGFSEAVTQGGKQLFAGSSLTESGRLSALAASYGAGHVKQTFTTTVQLAGLKQALIRRDVLSGGFEDHFGSEADFVFSIQPCNQLQIRYGIPECADESTSPPTAVKKRILLVGGEKVTVQFPEGVEWTYQVLDQTSPLISK